MVNGSETQQVVLSLVTGVFSCLFLLVICFANALVILAVVIDPLKKLRSPFNYFVANLAVSDLIVGLLGMPTAIYYHFAEYRCKSSTLAEHVFYLALLVTLTASILCLVALSIDRYAAITFPIWYRNNMTCNKCRICSFFISLPSLTLPFICLKVGYNKYLMIFTTSAVVIGLLVLIVTYFRIRYYLQAQAVRVQTNIAQANQLEDRTARQQKKLTKFYLLIVLLFLLCYIPATALTYVLQFCSICSCPTKSILKDVACILLTLNSCINPFLYATSYKHYRRAIMVIIKRKTVAEYQSLLPNISSQNESPAQNSLDSSSSSDVLQNICS